MVASLIQYTNNAKTTLGSPLTNTATTINLASGGGALFPPLNVVSQICFVTLVDFATQAIVEIVKVTARSGDTLTVVRGQEGTTPVAWATGDYVKLLFTAHSIEYLDTGRYVSRSLYQYSDTVAAGTPGILQVVTAIGANRIRVYQQAGGGSGGSTPGTGTGVGGNGVAAGGGGSGGYHEFDINLTNGPQTLTLHIGNGGAAPSPGGITGNAGGDTYISGSSYPMARGGQGGQTYNFVGAFEGSPGGTGGDAIGGAGIIGKPGQCGLAGFFGGYCISGQGGNSEYGGGGGAVGAAAGMGSNGAPGRGAGSGGSGASTQGNNSPGYYGGAGATGQIILEYWTS